MNTEKTWLYEKVLNEIWNYWLLHPVQMSGLTPGIGSDDEKSQLCLECLSDCMLQLVTYTVYLEPQEPLLSLSLQSSWEDCDRTPIGCVAVSSLQKKVLVSFGLSMCCVGKWREILENDDNVKSALVGWFNSWLTQECPLLAAPKLAEMMPVQLTCFQLADMDLFVSILSLLGDHGSPKTY